MKGYLIPRRFTRRIWRRIRKRLLALFLACFVFMGVVYCDYREAQAASIVIGGVVITAGEAFALLLATAGITATSVAVYDNRESLQAWGDKQLDSFCDWLSTAEGAVWSAQQDVEQWTLSLMEGGLNKADDLWGAFKKWASRLYFPKEDEDYILGPDLQNFHIEYLSEIIGKPVNYGIYMVGYPNYVVASDAWGYLNSYDYWYTLPLSGSGWVISSYNPITMEVDTINKRFRFNSVGDRYGELSLSQTGNKYSFIEGRVVGEFPSSWYAFNASNISSICISPSISVFIDDAPLASEDNNEYAYAGKIGELVERDGNLDNLDLVNPGAADPDKVSINWANLSPETLPETLGNLATGAQTLSDVLAQAGVAAVDALTGSIIEGDAEADLDIDNEGGIFSWLSNIVEWLKKIWNAILSIPVSIAAAIENVVVGVDDGNYKISDIVTDKFPFCIPFDLIHCFQVVQANPVAPVWNIPFVIDNQYIKYNHEITIDLTDWERPAVVIRYFILLIYIAGLVYATRYVIKG